MPAVSRSLRAKMLGPLRRKKIKESEAKRDSKSVEDMTPEERAKVDRLPQLRDELAKLEAELIQLKT